MNARWSMVMTCPLCGSKESLSMCVSCGCNVCSKCYDTKKNVCSNCTHGNQFLRKPLPY